MKTKISLSLSAVLLFLSISLSGQTQRHGDSKLQNPKEFQKGRTGTGIFIDPEMDATVMIQDFFTNSCMTPFNVTKFGCYQGQGYFDDGMSSIGVQSGILLSSGNALNASGPNTSTSMGNGCGVGSDIDLFQLSQKAIFDASGVEFDFTSSKPDLFFEFVFGSEEYPEYVGSNFNDVFGFFISGPGINGGFTFNGTNIATINGDPITVNYINGGQLGSFGSSDNVNPPKGSLLNSSWYVDNPGGQEIEYDGFTKPLKANFTVVPGQTYHVKLAIGDAGDGIFDSGILISNTSLCGNVIAPIPSFLVQNIDNKTIAITNQTKYASEWIWDFGDGTTYAGKYPPPHTYTQEGSYLITLHTSNSVGPVTMQKQISTSVKPMSLQEVKIIPPTCSDQQNGSIVIQIGNGTPPYQYLWNTGATTPEINQCAQGKYSIIVTDAAGKQFTQEFEVIAPKPITCVLGIGTSDNVWHLRGGTPPYSVAWSDGTQEENVTQITKTAPSMVITDANQCTLQWSPSQIPVPTKKWPTPIQIHFMQGTQQLFISSQDVDLLEGNLDVDILDALGRCVFHKNTSLHAISSIIELPKLHAGNYIIQCTLEDQTMHQSIWVRD